jgi:hypothetical protein
LEQPENVTGEEGDTVVCSPRGGGSSLGLVFGDQSRAAASWHLREDKKEGEAVLGQHR